MVASARAETQGARVGVVGASGYSGAVATRILAHHPSFALSFATSDRKAGEPALRALGIAAPDAHAHAHARAALAAMKLEPNASAPSLVDRCDVVLLATSARVSAELAPIYLHAKKHVVDLSGAFRLEHVSDYLKWYGFEHPAPALLASARTHYGLPELFGAPPNGDGGATLVANPGCYPTAALLALAPLLRAGLIEPRGIVVDAKSGVTGAGRQATDDYSFVEVANDLRAYKLLVHQHTPEITRALSRVTAGVELVFTPHLLPVPRGLLATCYARPRKGASASAVAECLADAYAKSAFVAACAPERVTLHSVVGTNMAHVGATANDDVVIAVGAIDNLLKGAAGQAVQNLNLLFGLDESLGLASLQRTAP